MPLLYVVPQRVQSNLDLTDLATVLTVAFSVTNFRYSALLPISADRADDRVLSEFGVDDWLPITAINDATIAIPIDYTPLYVPLNMYGGGQYSLQNSITYVSVGPFTMSNDGGSALKTAASSVSPNPVLSNDGGSALENANYNLSPALLQSVVPNGSTYAVDRDTVDPYVSTNVVLLVPADGGDGSTNIVDNIGHGISVVGNTAISATQSKFGGSSLYFDGTGDYLTLPNSADWAMGTGDFTVEGWIYPTTLTPYSTNSSRVLVDLRATASGAGIAICMGSGGYPFVYCAPLGWNGAGTTQKFVVNTWNHFAFVRRGTEFFFFVNGKCGQYLTATANLTDNALTIGTTIDYRDTSANYKFQGYMDALRITKGVARYIEKFTPPAVMFPTPAVADSLYPYASDPYASDVVLQMDSTTRTAAFDHKSTSMTLVNSPGSTIPSKSKLSRNSLQLISSSSQYVNVASNMLAGYGGDITIDCWVNLDSLPTGTAYNNSFYILGGGQNNGNPGVDFALGSTAIWFNQSNYLTRLISAPWSPATNTWYHIALVRSGTTWTIYLNGSAIGSATSSTAFDSSIAAFAIGRDEQTGGDSNGYFNGRIEQLRITKRARWSANFIPPTVRVNQVDPYANKVVLHLPFENSGGNGSLLWEATGKALTATGTINTGGSNDAYKGLSCAMFTSGSYMSAPASSDFNLGSGDFTVELWMNSSASNAYATLIDRPSASGFTAGAWSLMFNSGTGNGLIALYVASYSTGSPLITGTIALNDGRWHHVAWTRSGSTHTLWIDGVQDVSVTWAGTIADLATNLRIGNNANYAGRDFVGSMDELRITKGACRYYAAFNPEIDDPFWNYTSVLLPLAADTSEVQGRTITTSGTVTTGQTSVARVYDTGATYLNSGLVLTAANNSMEPGSGDFTYEFWFNTASSARQWFFAASSDWWVGVDYNYVGAGLFGFYLSSNGTSWDIALADPGGNSRGSVSAPLNKWNHVALVRKGTAITLYVNGVADKTITVTAGTSIVNKSGQQKRIGNHGTANYPVIGYMQDFRFTKGYARYTSNFVPGDCPMPTTDMIDKSYNNVTTLLPMSNDLVDKKNNTYTNTGITFAEDDSFGKAAVFNGSAYYSSNNNINWQDTTDATFEAWVYAASWATWSSDWGSGAIPSLMFSGQATTKNVYWAFGPTADAKLTFYYWSGALNFFKSTSTLSVNAWHHIALSKQGTTLRFFIDGVLDTTTTYSATAATAAMLFTGGNVNAVGLTGRVRNLRVTQGYARYLRKFNPAKVLATRLS